MNLQHLNYFLKIAETENMTEASDYLKVAQPALSRSIKLLEEELGITLFDRVGRKLKLNRFGEIVQKYVSDINRSLEDMQKELEDNKGIDNTIKLGVRAASKQIPELLLEFHNIYPDVNFSIIQNADLESCDVIIDAGLVTPTSKNTIKIMEEEIKIAMPKNHELAKKSKLDLLDFSNEQFISLSKGSLNTIIAYYCGQWGFSPTITFESNDPALIRAMIRMGLGISFIPSKTWDKMEDASIVIRSLDDDFYSREVYLTYNSERYLSKMTDTFIKFTKEYFARLK